MQKEGKVDKEEAEELKKEEEVKVDKRFAQIILLAFVLVFLLSYSYKFGNAYYEIIPWIFFSGMILSIGSVIGLLMFPVALIFQTFFYFKLTFLPIAFTSLYLLVAAAVLVGILLIKKEKIKKDANLYLIIILGAAAVLSTFLNGYNVGFGNSEFTHYAEAVFLVLLIPAFVSTKKKLRMFAWILLLGVASLALRLYSHVYTYDYALPGFENNYLARIFSFYIPFFIGFFWAERNKYMKLVILVVLAFTVQGMTQLGSRATYIATGIALLLLAIKNVKKKSIWVFAGLGVVFLLFFTPPSFFNDLESVFIHAPQGAASEEGSIAGRFIVAKQGWNTFLERPILGYGIYPSIFENLMLEKYGWFKSGHNAFIIIAVEMGLFGLLTYISLFGFSIYFCYKAQKIAKDKFVKNIAEGTMFGLVALALNQYMLNNPWIPTAFIAFGLSSAIHYLAKEGQEGTFKISQTLMLFFTFASIGVSLMLVFYFILSLLI